MTSLSEHLRGSRPDEEFVGSLVGSNRARTLTYRDQVARYLRTAHGLTAGRPLLPEDGSARDRGEIDGVPGWSLLCARQKALDLPAAVTRAEDHADRYGNPRSAAVVHRPRRPTEAAYVVMSLSQFAELINELPETKGAPRDFVV